MQTAPVVLPELARLDVCDAACGERVLCQRLALRLHGIHVLAAHTTTQAGWTNSYPALAAIGAGKHERFLPDARLFGPCPAPAARSASHTEPPRLTLPEKVLSQPDRH